MAIPSTPQNMLVQSANQQILISWDLSAGATYYKIQRSLDNVTFTDLVTLSGSPLATSYVDSAVTLGVNYWYKVAASSDDITYSNYANAQSGVPVPSAELTLGQIRLASQQRADRVNSQFVTTPEWNFYINQSMYELYDLLVTLYEDLYVATPIQFQTVNNQYLYDLPNGSNTFLNPLTGATFTPSAMYKLLGVDLQSQNGQNGYITLNRFNFIERNKYFFPNTASTLYGVFNMAYRTMGTQIEFIPAPSGGQMIRLWYVPKLRALLQDTDITTLGTSGWLQYVIIRAAKYALDKEESDTTKLDAELLFLKARIEESASNRDAGQPDTISNTRNANGYWGMGSGWNGSSGGF